MTVRAAGLSVAEGNDDVDLLPTDIESKGRTRALTCEDAEILVSRELDSQLSPGDRPALDIHLETCEACRVQREMWRSHDQQAHEEVRVLWPERPSVRTRIATRSQALRPQMWRRRWIWIPLGAVAAQVLAVIGLAAYFVLFAPQAQAPQNRIATLPVRPSVAASAPQPEPRAGSVAQVGRASVPAKTTFSGDGQGHSPDSPPPPHTPKEPVAVPDSAPTGILVAVPRTEIQEHVSAMLLPAPAAVLMPNVFAEYVIDDVGDAGLRAGRDAGRITLLGDVFAGKAVLRLVDTQGVRTEVAQADVDTVLPAPQRAVARRFIAACLRPEMRSRFAEALRRAERK
ncbi:MAG TPA: zf-HC2 domain-containing protein [Planctomycetota bacterium]|jgi:hypothetical protein